MKEIEEILDEKARKALARRKKKRRRLTLIQFSGVSSAFGTTDPGPGPGPSGYVPTYYILGF